MLSGGDVEVLGLFRVRYGGRCSSCRRSAVATVRQRDTALESNLRRVSLPPLKKPTVRRQQLGRYGEQRARKSVQ